MNCVVGHGLGRWGYIARGIDGNLVPLCRDRYVEKSYLGMIGGRDECCHAAKAVRA